MFLVLGDDGVFFVLGDGCSKTRYIHENPRHFIPFFMAKPCTIFCTFPRFGYNTLLENNVESFLQYVVEGLRCSPGGDGVRFA